MNRMVFVAVMALLACAGVGSGCGDSEDSRPLAGWTTFESEEFQGESVSLQIPDSFVGGNLHQPSVVAELERKIDQCPDPEQAESLRDVLATETEEGQPDTLALLWMLGPFDAEGRCPEVYVRRSGSCDDFASLEKLVEHEKSTIELAEGSSFAIKSITEDRADAELRIELTDKTLLLHLVYISSPEYFYRAYYSPPDASDTTFDSIFDTSAETFVVKEG